MFMIISVLTDSLPPNQSFLIWSIGEMAYNKITNAVWGDNIVDKLSDYLKSVEHNAKVFSSRNIWRMKKFYETYKDQTNLSTLLTEMS